MQLGPGNAFWIDGEWVGWDSIIEPLEPCKTRLAELERAAHLRHHYPKADPKLVPYFHDLLTLAATYFEDTGKHLNVYGDIGELFGAITYGIALHKNYAKGSDGRMGNDFVEIKTISPMSSGEKTHIRLDRHFNRLLLVRIDENFEVTGKLLHRKDLPKRAGKHLGLSCSTACALPGQGQLTR